jgi:hypothetical protein
MDEINVMDRVQIVRTESGAPDSAGQFGRVYMVVDDTKCFVRLDNGGVATVNADQLKKVS